MPTTRRRRRARWTLTRRAADYLFRFHIPGDHHRIWDVES